MTDPRPCEGCGKPHENIGPFDQNGKRLIDDWRDPDDGHAYYPPSWEDFARSLAAGRAVQDDGLPTVEALADALEAEGFVRGVSQRYGTFNRPYFEQSAESILARLRAAPPLHASESGRTGMPARSRMSEGTDER